MNWDRGIPTPEQIRMLKVQDEDTLAEWYHILSIWGWPEGLDDPEKNPHYTRVSNRGAVMHWIKEKVSQKKLLHHWNVVLRKYDPMTEEEFAEWWAGNYEGDEEAKQKADNRLIAKVEKEMANNE